MKRNNKPTTVFYIPKHELESAWEPLDINTATAEEFATLPGIGNALAAEIVTYRAEHGLFMTVERLTDVPGIGPAKLEAIKDDICVKEMKG